MLRRTLGLLTGVLVLFILSATPAVAIVPIGSPATVGVRVEGLSGTVLPRTTLTTTTTPVVNDGTHSCSGTSAAGALDLATAGSWAGTYNSSFFDYSVDTIKGETHLFSGSDFWSLFVNGYAAQTGICGLQLQQGDELLFAAIPQVGTTGVLKLAGVPTTAKPGVPFTVTVTRFVTTYDAMYNAVNTSAPASGVTVAAGAASATTGADGTTSLTLTAGGPASVLATKTGEVRSIAEPVCVTDGADGFCGTVKPGATATTTAPPVTSAAIVPVADALPALPTIGGLGEQARFKAAKAPRELKGTVAADASGVKDVLLSITRRSGKLCERYDGAKTAWMKMPVCGAQHGRFFSIGPSPTWSYLLPAALTKGRYVLDVRTVDGAGNVTHGAERGATGAPRTRVVFFVD